jgi:hypothetical protein
MELDDAELQLIAHAVGITTDALARKLVRLPVHMKPATEIEHDQYEALLRRLKDEQRSRRKATA